MITPSILLSLLLTVPLSAAWDAPEYYGFNRVWQDPFTGAPGTLPDEGLWNIITGNLGVNAELQEYRRDPRNVQHSGGGTLQLVPWRDGSAYAGWTSGRIESKYTLTPAPDRLTRVEAVLRFGDGDPAHTKQGIWPAWWMLGDSLRHPGGAWPQCGELDILETVNGQLLGHGTMHCGTFPGGVCNEGTGIQAQIPFPDQGWHTWRLEIDLRPGNWVDQAIVWYFDGNEFQRITGARIGDYGIWQSVAHSPLYFILNLAVGGHWPGYPDGNTHDGYGSMMEVAYAAHYVS